jgi:hypothetical protein
MSPVAILILEMTHNLS